MGFEFDFQRAQVVTDDPFINDSLGHAPRTFVPVTDGLSGNGKRSVSHDSPEMLE